MPRRPPVLVAPGDMYTPPNPSLPFSPLPPKKKQNLLNTDKAQGSGAKLWTPLCIGPYDHAGVMPQDDASTHSFEHLVLSRVPDVHDNRLVPQPTEHALTLF